MDAPDSVSSASIQAHNLEAEVGVIMEKDLGPKPDGSHYTVNEVWASVEFVVPVIEICGRRSTAKCLAAQVLFFGVRQWACMQSVASIF